MFPPPRPATASRPLPMSLDQKRWDRGIVIPIIAVPSSPDPLLPIPPSPIICRPFRLPREIPRSRPPTDRANIAPPRKRYRNSPAGEKSSCHGLFITPVIPKRPVPHPHEPIARMAPNSQVVSQRQVPRLKPRPFPLRPRERHGVATGMNTNWRMEALHWGRGRTRGTVTVLQQGLALRHLHMVPLEQEETLPIRSGGRRKSFYHYVRGHGISSIHEYASESPRLGSDPTFSGEKREKQKLLFRPILIFSPLFSFVLLSSSAFDPLPLRRNIFPPLLEAR
jgi:hypothetical protein